MKKLKGDLVFKKVSQGIARFDAFVKGVGNFTLQLDSKILGDYDPFDNRITGKIELKINIDNKPELVRKVKQAHPGWNQEKQNKWVKNALENPKDKEA